MAENLPEFRGKVDSPAFVRWLEILQRKITRAANLLWEQIDKVGSTLADIEGRDHDLLTDRDAADSHPWSAITKTGSSLADLATRTHAQLTAIMGWVSGADTMQNLHVSQANGKKWEDHADLSNHTHHGLDHDAAYAGKTDFDTHVSDTANPHDTTLQQAAAAGATITSNVTFTGRAIVPMGELSYFSITGTGVTITAQSDGSTNMVKAAPATTLSNDSGFDNGGADNGRLRYTGATTKMFHVACSISISPAAANDVFVFGVAKNGTVVSSSKILLQAINANNPRSSAMHAMVELATNDYLEMYVGNTTDADDCTVLSLNIFAMGM